MPPTGKPLARARNRAGSISASVAEEAAEIAAMSCAERRELLLKGEKKLGRLYKKGAMATVRREWRGVADTAYDFYEWLRIWGMLLGTFSAISFRRSTPCCTIAG